MHKGTGVHACTYFCTSKECNIFIKPYIKISEIASVVSVHCTLATLTYHMCICTLCLILENGKLANKETVSGYHDDVSCSCNALLNAKR